MRGRGREEVHEGSSDVLVALHVRQGLISTSGPYRCIRALQVPQGLTGASGPYRYVRDARLPMAPGKLPERAALPNMFLAAGSKHGKEGGGKGTF